MLTPPSTDQDAEAQDPLKAAIREALKSVEVQLQEVKEHVESEVAKIAKATVNKLREMDPSVAETLDPVVNTKKWDSLFTTSITGDEGIPLNKRGSGVKRLVLLNFFRAKAEKLALEANATSIIYAIEEPETSQHPSNQILLLNALRELSDGDGKQVIVTTHTPTLARRIDEKDLRFITKNDEGKRSIAEGGPELSEAIANSLGVLPDHNVKLFIGLEGVHDISFLQGISRMLINHGETVPDLEQLERDGELIFIPLGGSNLDLWAARLAELNRPELHICDRDYEPPRQPKYESHIEKVNARSGCTALATEKRELENYLHPDAISEAYGDNGINISFEKCFADFDDIPILVAEKVHLANSETPWLELEPEKRSKKERKAKKVLNSNAVAKMTPQRLTEVDPKGEIEGWLKKIDSYFQPEGKASSERE